MTKTVERRRFIALTGTSIAVGLAGCTSSGDTNSPDEQGTSNATDTPEPQNAAIESVEVGTKELTIALTGDVEVDSLVLVNPDGSERESTSVSAAASTATMAYFDTYEEYAYTAGDYTVSAVKDEEVVQEKTVTLRPELVVTAIDGTDDGRAILTLENTGNASAWIRGGRVEGGKQEANENDDLTPEGARTEDDEVIAPGESKTFYGDSDAFRYSPKSDEYDEYCTGEGEFAHDLTIVVEDPALGTVTGDVSVALTGEKKEDSWMAYSCTTVEPEGLPVTLSSSE